MYKWWKSYWKLWKWIHNWPTPPCVYRCQRCQTNLISVEFSQDWLYKAQNIFSSLNTKFKFKKFLFSCRALENWDNTQNSLCLLAMIESGWGLSGGGVMVNCFCQLPASATSSSVFSNWSIPEYYVILILAVLLLCNV